MNYPLFINGVWETLPHGTWVEIVNGLGDFSGARGTITHGPYGGPKDCVYNNIWLPPMYNILVTPPHRESAIGVNFEAHRLRKLTSREVTAEKRIRKSLPEEQQTNSFTIVDGKRIPNLYPEI